MRFLNFLLATNGGQILSLLVHLRKSASDHHCVVGAFSTPYNRWSRSKEPSPSATVGKPETCILLQRIRLEMRPNSFIACRRGRNKCGSENSSSTSCSSSLEEASSMDTPYPRAAVSVAVRCLANGQAHYLLVQRGNEPNKGRWSFAGGKLEWGETTVEAAKRELLEETQFQGQDGLAWFAGSYATADSIVMSEETNIQEENRTVFHFMIGICFAELTIVADSSLPKVTAADDAAEAKWWTMEEIRAMEDVESTPGLLKHIERAEHLYLKGALPT